MCILLNCLEVNSEQLWYEHLSYWALALALAMTELISGWKQSAKESKMKEAIIAANKLLLLHNFLSTSSGVEMSPLKRHVLQTVMRQKMMLIFWKNCVPLLTWLTSFPTDSSQAYLFKKPSLNEVMYYPRNKMPERRRKRGITVIH